MDNKYRVDIWLSPEQVAAIAKNKDEWVALAVEVDGSKEKIYVNGERVKREGGEG